MQVGEASDVHAADVAALREEEVVDAVGMAEPRDPSMGGI